MNDRAIAFRSVSIPKRVSEALKHNLFIKISLISIVSIPKRVSEALKPLESGGNLAGINTSFNP